MKPITRDEEGEWLFQTLVPGGVTLVRSIMRVITQPLQLIVDVISFSLKKLAALGSPKA